MIMGERRVVSFLVLVAAAGGATHPGPVRAADRSPRVFIEFSTVHFDVPTHCVVGAHYAVSEDGSSVKDFDYYLEAAPGDTAVTLDFPPGDLSVQGGDLSRAAGDELVRRRVMVVNQPRAQGEAKEWTRPDRSLDAKVIAVTYSSYSDPPRERSRSSVIVVWTVRDSATGEVLFGTTTPGSDSMEGMGIECVRRAFLDAVARLLDDEDFVSVMSVQ